MSSLIKIYPKRDSKVILVYVAEEVPLYKSRPLIQVQGEVLPCMCVSHACSIILGGTTRNAKLALSRLEDLNFQRQLLTELRELLWRFLWLVKKKKKVLESALASSGGSEETDLNGFSMTECCLSSLRRGPTCLATLLGNTTCQCSCISLASPEKKKDGQQALCSPKRFLPGTVHTGKQSREPADDSGRRRVEEGQLGKARGFPKLKLQSLRGWVWIFKGSRLFPCGRTVGRGLKLMRNILLHFHRLLPITWS